MIYEVDLTLEDFQYFMSICIEWLKTEFVVFGYRISFWWLGWFFVAVSIAIWVLHEFFD